jgi:hypothetical protein
MTSLQTHRRRLGSSAWSPGKTRQVRGALTEMTNGKEVTLELRSGERLRGVFCGFVDDQALLSTLRGGRRVAAREIEKILIKVTTPAPKR